jgi:hypothetical protein
VFELKVANFKHPDGKRDAGDALTNPEVAEWVAKVISDAMDVSSPAYFQWQLETR